MLGQKWNIKKFSASILCYEIYRVIFTVKLKEIIYLGLIKHFKLWEMYEIHFTSEKYKVGL